MKRKAQTSYEYLWTIAIAFFFITMGVYYTLHSKEKPLEVQEKAETTLSDSLTSAISSASP